MLLYAVVILLLVNVSASHSGCCEGEAVSKSLLDTASDLISKAKSSIPSCSGNEGSGNDGSGNDGSGNDGSGNEECPKEYLDCADLYKSGYNKSGVFNITSVNRLFYKKNFQVYCDMETEGGGWTVIQRRGNFGSPNDFFYNDWENYKNGFGSPEADFWIGNDKIFALTNQKPYSIRFDMEQEDKRKFFAKYDSFWINDEYNNYTLHISGYNGSAGDCMMVHNTQPFSTKDKANAWHTENKHNCAVNYKGGWWYKSCYHVNINGLYNDKTTSGINWNCGSGTRIMTWTEMKIRPVHFGQKSAARNLNLAKRNSIGKSYLTKFIFSRK